MSAFSACPVRFVFPQERYIGNYPPRRCGLIPVGPYYYQNYYVAGPESFPQDSTPWPARRSSFRPYSTTKSKWKEIGVNDEYEKPNFSYVELIASAILDSPKKRLVLGDIYEAISRKYPYFSNKGNGWRNSIRHNLSLSDCFIKGERSANGKGHLWEVNAECYEDTLNGKARSYRRKSVKPKLENTYETHTKDCKKEIISLSPTERKMSLESLLQFDDEIREFELASRKLSGLGEHFSESDLKKVQL